MAKTQLYPAESSSLQFKLSTLAFSLKSDVSSSPSWCLLVGRSLGGLGGGGLRGSGRGKRGSFDWCVG